jgi:hypothetical protein
MTKINDSVSVGAELAARITRMTEMLGGECPYVTGRSSSPRSVAAFLPGTPSLL